MDTPTPKTPSRIAFWLGKHHRTFCYGTSKTPQSRGVGLAVDGYNLLTDNVRVRWSELGYITSFGTMTRDEYWKARHEFAEEDRRK